MLILYPTSSLQSATLTTHTRNSDKSLTLSFRQRTTRDFIFYDLFTITERFFSVFACIFVNSLTLSLEYFYLKN